MWDPQCQSSATHVPCALQLCCVLMLLAAFLPPTPRVLGFATGIITMVVMHGRMVLNVNLSVQLLLYLVGAIAFLRSPLSLASMPIWCCLP